MRIGPPVATPIRTVEPVEVFANRFGQLFNDRTEGVRGTPGRYLRWMWAGAGVVVVPVHGGRVGLWSMYRYPIGTSSWEFPRGGAEAGESTVAAAVRELREETGLTGRAARLLGSLYAETGLIGSSISVVAVEVDSTTVQSAGVEEMESVGNAVWLTDDDMRDSIAAGRLSCAITIAAFTMYAAGHSGRPLERDM